jgi:hypothetical protein
MQVRTTPAPSARPIDAKYHLLDVLQSPGISSSVEDRILATQAYQNRFRRHLRHHDVETSRGMKRIRVDFLMGHTHFAGPAS